MRFTRFAWVLPLFLVLVAAGCGGDSGSTGSAGCDDTDTFLWDGTPRTEAQSTINSAYCDPQIQTYSYADLASSGNPGLNILLHFGLKSDGTTFQNFVSINVYNQATGTYTLGAGTGTTDAGLIFVSTASGSYESCVASTGTLTLTTVDAVGGKVEGTYQVDTVSGAGCPTSIPIVGNFSTDRKAEP